MDGQSDAIVLKVLSAYHYYLISANSSEYNVHLPKLAMQNRSKNYIW